MKIEMLNSLKHYSKKLFIDDTMAGLIVAIVALPLSIAFGIASGVNPNQSLITAIVAGFIVSALGGTKFQIAGPTGAFVVLIYSIVQKYGLSGLMTATIMSGILLMLFGFLKLGNFIKFISLRELNVKKGTVSTLFSSIVLLLKFIISPFLFYTIMFYLARIKILCYNKIIMR